MDRARGILPTYVTAREVVLAKAAPRLINSYEIRLALFMAVQRKRQFILAVLPECAVAADLLSHLARFGGRCQRGTIQEFSVYFGAADAAGVELDGWVLGDREAWESFRTSITSERLRTALVPGTWLTGEALQELTRELTLERTEARNVDEEPVVEAIAGLVETASRAGGALFVQ